MRELRTCPVTGRTVVLNDAWLDPPPPAPPAPGPCPWCAPAERVIEQVGAVSARPHPVPALGVEGSAEVHTAGGRVWREAVGAHEVIAGPHDGPDAPLLALAAARIRDLRGDTRLRGFRLARAERPGAHVAWQLWALPVDVPVDDPARWRDEELALGERVAALDAHAVAVFAWAPRAPFEVWVLPRQGRARFGEDDPAAVADLLARLIPAWAGLLRGAPLRLHVRDGTPWRIEVVPDLGSPDDVGALLGLPFHGAFPEAAARYLRARGGVG